MKIIVGLGNPDSKYEGSRHNLGFLAVERLAETNGLPWHFDKNFNALVAKGFDYYLVKPQTYMNNSGQAVQKIMAYYHLLPVSDKGKVMPNANLADSLTVIHDDLDIALGFYKYVTGGSAGGHYGVQSIIDALGTADFGRLRLGIATAELQRRRKSLWPNAVGRFVLKKLPAEEKALAEQTVAKALSAI
jgi:PTH1 family peptidyl-tRNA hydrolase